MSRRNGWLWVSPTSGCEPDGTQYIIEPEPDLLVCEVENGQAAAMEHQVSLPIVLTRTFMNGAINLNDHACVIAVEVRNQSVDHLLTAKV